MVQKLQVLQQLVHTCFHYTHYTYAEEVSEGLKRGYRWYK